MSDSDWMNAPTDAAEVSAAPVEVAPSTLGAVARRISEVSPDWHSVTIDPARAPGTAELPRLSRMRTQGVEAIREGWLLHRNASRVCADASEDLALLIGDWCYAAGLCTIADEGTLDDVARLAALIANVSARHDEPIEQLQARWDETTAAMRHV